MKSSINVNSDNTATYAQKLTRNQKLLHEIAKKAVTIKAISNREYKYYSALALIADDELAYSLRHCLDMKYYRKKDQELLKLKIQSNRYYRHYQRVTGQYQYPRIP